MLKQKRKRIKGFYTPVVILFVFSQFLISCSVVRTGMESGSALMEDPSMELVLDRMNTAGAASDLVTVVLNEMPISDTACWPRRLESFSEKDLEPLLKALSLDGVYQSHGGIVSPIKAHVVQVQNILYEVPPDMYALSGDFYTKGEATIINGTYYKINSYKNIVVKADPCAKDVTEGLSAMGTNFLVKNSKGEIEKRRGLLKNFDVTGTNQYENLMEALFAIAPNDAGTSLKSAYNAYENSRGKVNVASEELLRLSADKKRLENKESPMGKFKTEQAIEAQLKIRQKELEELTADLEEKKNIFNKEMDNLESYKGTIDDPESVRVLLNIIYACKGAEGLMIDSVGLAGIAAVKLVRSLPNLPNEIKMLTPGSGGLVKKEKGFFDLLGGAKTVPEMDTSLWYPIRLARIKNNAGNVKDSISCIVQMLETDLALVRNIHSKAELLLNPEAAKEIKQAMEQEPLTEEGVGEHIVQISNQTSHAQEIQSLLARLSYDPGPVDGKPGRKTREAVKTFQEDFGYSPTGRVNKTTLTLLRCASEMKFNQNVDIQNKPACLKKFVMEIQKNLKELGYNPGAVDGQPGQKTFSAIQNFQAGNGYSVNDGTPDQKTLMLLKQKFEHKND
ncbi:MAG: peptidoglycan-binding protein [Desulfobacter sp.]